MSSGAGWHPASPLAHLKIKALPLLAVAGGGLVFGLGFAVAGYCPGTCLVGAAEGRRDATFTVLGGLAGALAYALVHPWAKQWLIEPIDLGKPTLHAVLGVSPAAAALVFGGALVALAFALPTHPGFEESAPRVAERA